MSQKEGIVLVNVVHGVSVRAVAVATLECAGAYRLGPGRLGLSLNLLIRSPDMVQTKGFKRVFNEQIALFIDLFSLVCVSICIVPCSSDHPQIFTN